MLRTVNDQLSLWDAILPSELLVLPDELARVDALLDDPGASRWVVVCQQLGMR